MPRGEKGTSKPFLKGKIWYIRYTVPGEKEQVRSSKSTSKEVAKRLLRDKLNEIDQRKATSTNARIDQLLQLYVAEYKRKGFHSYKQAEGYVRLHLKPAFGPILAGKLTSQQINSFIDQKRVAKYANATINRWLEALQHAYALGMKNLPPLVHVSPEFSAFMLDESENVREGFLNYDEYLRMRDELPDHQKLILVLGYHYGMRSGEITKLRWNQVDWTAGLIRLEKKQTKAKQARVAPFYGEVRAWLEMARAMNPETDLIVSWRGEGIEETKTAWNKARVRAGVPELHVHDLRRTGARNMIRAGVQEKLVMRIVGWRTRAMFDRYNILEERDAHAAVPKLDSYMEDLARQSSYKVRTVEPSSTKESIQ